MSYETLDTIADSYIPFLAIILLLSIFWSSTLGQRFVDRMFKPASDFLVVVAAGKYEWLGQLVVVIFGVIIVYGIGYFDSHFHFWSSASLDYSTHTALALVLIANIVAINSKNTIRVTAVFSFFVYLLLMDYQGYHTWLDMLSTALVIAFTLTVVLALKRLLRKTPSVFS